MQPSEGPFRPHSTRSMPLSFKKAPLAEIIAELRWNTPYVPHAPTPVPVSLTGSNRIEEFLMRFGGEVYQQEFQRSERLVPASFPMLPFQVVYRYKRPSDPAHELLQAGAGIFTANALPPYKSWAQFEPIVAGGVSALIRARGEGERELPFSMLTLRYLDAFGDEFLRGASPARFITEVLGFDIKAPRSIEGLLRSGSEITPFVQLTVPTGNQLELSVSVGEGVFGGARAVVMDTAVSCSEAVAPSVDSVMAVFNEARRLIHDSFVSISRPLHDFMEPVEE